MLKVTLWYCKAKDKKKFNYNHLEDGHSECDKPQPIKKEFTNQLTWGKSEWKKEFVYLKDGKIYR